MRKFFAFALTSIMALTMLSGCATAGAQVSPSATPEPEEVLTYDWDGDEDVNEVVSEGEDDGTQILLPYFISVTGTITEIHPIYRYEDGEALQTEDEFQVWLETETGTVVFNVDHHTFLLAEDRLEIGAEVVGFYDGFLPVMLIYPPHYHARVLAPVYSDEFRYSVDVNFITHVQEGPYMGEVSLTMGGSGRQIVLYIIQDGDNTEVVLQDGTPFEGGLTYLENRSVVFVRNDENDSNKIVVLFERAVHPIHYLTEEELAMIEAGEDGEGWHDGQGIGFDDSWSGGLQLTQEDLDIMWDNMLAPDAQIIVNGTALESAPAPFVNREVGAVMLPVAAVSEALGYNVVGEGAEVVIGPGIIFRVGVDDYFFARMAPVQLGAAPELHDGVLFVPMQFFYNVMPGVAYINYGHVIVNMGE